MENTFFILHLLEFAPLDALSSLVDCAGFASLD
jgi:hypothetical protein